MPRPRARSPRPAVELLEPRDVPATLLGVTDLNALLRFDSATPGTVTSTTITGLNGGESVLGADFRPADGRLYAVTTQNRLLTIDPATGAAAPVAALTADPTDTTNPFTALNGTAFGVDFNPVADRLRVVSDTNQNLRINPDSGRVVTDANVNPGTPDLVAAAYSNNFAGTTATTLYGIDAAANSLVIQNPPNNGTLTTVGTNLGAGIDATLATGFDIVTAGGPTRVSTAFASLTSGGLVRLYTVDLTAGTAALVGTIGGGATPVHGLAVVPAGTLQFAAEAVPGAENGGAVTVTVTRTGGSLGAVGVDFAATGVSATAGQDFTAATGTLTFADGDTTPKTFTVTLLDDQLAEGIETVSLSLSNPTNGAVTGRGTAVLTIRDNESPSDHLYAVTAANALLEFDAADPGAVLRSIPVQLAAGDVVEGIDVRPATGRLYALVVNGAAGRLVTIDPDTGATTPVAPLAADPADTTNPFTALAGVDFGFDFNPTNDRIRVVSDADVNLSVDPDGGLVTTQTTLTGGAPNAVGSAYTNSFAGAGTTTLYAIDSGTDSLYTQNPPANGVLTLVGALGFDTSGQVGFEISPFGNEAFASLTAPAATTSSLFLVNLTSGAATRVGTIGGGGVVNGLTSVPGGFLSFAAPAATVSETGGLVTLAVTRTGGSTGAVSAVVAVAGGTATPGADFAVSPATVTFADGDTAPKTVTVTVVQDIASEPTETVQLALTGPAGGAFFGPTASSTVTILDTRPTLAVGGAGDGSAALFTPAPGGPFNPTAAATVAPFGGVAADVRTATADVNNDGFADFVLVTGPGVPLRVAVLSGADGALLVAPFDPFGGDFPGGGYVAAADLDNDGRAEFVVTPDQGGGPRVSVFSLNPDGSTSIRANFFGIDDPAFRGGARAALGDVNHDGAADVVVAAGFGGGPRTAVFTGQSVLAGSPARLVADFFAFPGADAVNLRNGSFVAAGDVTGDGFDDLVFGGGPGGAPRVFILSGARVSAGQVDAAQAAPVANFFVAGDVNDRGGARVATTDADRDARADVVVGSGAGRPARVRVYLGKDFAGPGEPATVQDITVLGGAVLADGVFVG